MDLIEIDVIHPEPLQAMVDRGHDRLARKSAGVRFFAPCVEALGRDDQLIAFPHLPQKPADDLFARALGVSVGGVEKINSELERARDEGAALFFV